MDFGVLRKVERTGGEGRGREKAEGDGTESR